MKITYLGTGASEGVPSLYCCCDLCKNALKMGGKEIRTRCGFLINDDLLIDFSADTFVHMVANKFDLSAVKDILITHSHEDHFYIPDLITRMESEVVERKEAYVTLHGNKTVVDIFEKANAQFTTNTFFSQTMNPWDEVRFGDYKVTAFKTKHIQNENSFIYLIESKGKTYFHILDSDYPHEGVFEYLKERRIKIDCVSADCTFGTMKEEFFGHMNVWENARLKARLEEIGALKKNSKYVLTHISHYCKDTFDSLNEVAQQFGMIVSYDGMVIDLNDKPKTNRPILISLRNLKNKTAANREQENN